MHGVESKVKGKLLIIPLLVALAFSMSALPVAAEMPVYVVSDGWGFAKVCPDFRDLLGCYVCGDARFIYHIPLDIAWLEFFPSDADAVYDIIEETIRNCEFFQTFKAVWMESMDTSPRNLDLAPDPNPLRCAITSELCPRTIRVITFLRGGDGVFVIVYGWGVFYLGCGSSILYEG